jgi:DHA1 family bicyclomycin/chloramphenicol resistance-like MFS transporter
MQGLTMACFAFTSSNFGTLAMEHMAPIAGTASSVQGVIGTLGSAAIGFAIGQAYDGTALPFIIGIAACSTIGFLIVVATEPKRLFASMAADPEEQEAARESTAIPEDLV